MKKTAPDWKDKRNLRLRLDNITSRRESGYARRKKGYVRTKIDPRDY